MTENGMLIFADDPVHRWQRSIANKAFTPRRVAELEPTIQAIADSVIDGFGGRGECDLFREFAIPFTIRVIAKVVGVDDSRIDDFFRWGSDVISAFGADADVVDRSYRSTMEFHAYFAEIVSKRRHALDTGGSVPNDIMTALITAESDGQHLNDAELFMGAQQIMTAGFETTASTIATGIWLVLSHPAQLSRLQLDPEKYVLMVEEVLRYAAPLEGLCRTANEDTEVGGIPIPKNGRVRWVMASANRDARVFDRPDEFDIDRAPKELRKHLAFGTGIHTCLGAALARMELKVAFSTLLRRLSNLRLDPHRNPNRNEALLINGFNYMPVVWEPTKSRSGGDSAATVHPIAQQPA
jgi:cytochrome P450